jgi:hypothetical protein
MRPVPWHWLPLLLAVLTTGVITASTPPSLTLLPGLDRTALTSRPGTAVFLNRPRRMPSNESLLPLDRPYEGGSVPNLGGGGGITYATVLRTGVGGSYMMWCKFAALLASL